MMYLWIMLAAALGAVGAWVIHDELGQREMKKLRQENEQLRNRMRLFEQERVKFTSTDVPVQKIFCETYICREDLDNPKNVAKHIERNIQRKMGETVLKFCDIDARVEPVMQKLIVRARLRVVPSEESKDIYTMIKQYIAETAESTRIGMTDFIAGNPGAARFVLEAYHKNALRAENGFLKMLSIGVVGDRLYMLWNDCCECDTVLAMAVMNEMPEEEILRHINYEQGRGIPFTDEEKEKLRYE